MEEPEVAVSRKIFFANLHVVGEGDRSGKMGRDLAKFGGIHRVKVVKEIDENTVQ